MSLPDWSPKPPEWSSDTFSLLIDSKVEKVSKQSLEDIIAKSEAFPIKFPIDTGRCKTLKNLTGKSILERNINSVYPVIHENVLELCCKFILYKRKYGTAKEQALYKEMNLINFINRLLTKRAVNFMGFADIFLLLNNESGAGNWESIGSDKESPPLVIRDCLSYDEIKLAVFLSVSSYSYFVNEGERTNYGKSAEKRDNIADEGIIIGIIGPRLKKPNCMEYQEIVTSKKQNIKKNGYGSKVSAGIHKFFAEFYGEPCLDYEKVLKIRNTFEGRYRNLSGGVIFDNHSYYKRLTISIDTLLIEANHRAKAAHKTAYIHVVGFGLGVWRISSHQDNVYMESFAKRIAVLGKYLQSVSDICFSYINQESCGGYKDGDVFNLDDHPFGGIKIHILLRNPHEKIPEGKLLVVSYAWDGNALPGNEYWVGLLGNSSDSAAASSTQIAEIHNPHINPLVSGDGLRIATNEGIVSFEEYQELVRGNKLKGEF